MSRRGLTARLLRLGVALLVPLATLTLVLPRVTGTTWQGVVAAWQQLPSWELAALAGLWFSGLVAHTWVLTGALPGLRRDRALTLNLTGSSVANLVPLGGGLGVALNLVMLRRWGFTSAEASLFTVLSSACNLLTKAVLPLAAVLLLLAHRSAPDPRLLAAGLGGGGLVVLGLSLAAAVLGTGAGTRAATAVVSVVRREPRLTVERRLATVRATTAAVVRDGWRSMAWGAAAYSILGVALLWCCVHAVGAPLGVVPVMVLFAVERGLTALPMTPGGAGVADLAMATLAVHLPGGPAGHHDLIAGILLYRAYTFGAEIPVGGIWLLGWLFANRQRPSRPPVIGAPEPESLAEVA